MYALFVLVGSKANTGKKVSSTKAKNRRNTLWQLWQKFGQN